MESYRIFTCQKKHASLCPFRNTPVMKKSNLVSDIEVDGIRQGDKGGVN